MLVRIRRLAGSVVGGGFILLLALSMLQMGDGSNPLSFFARSPKVLEVGSKSISFDQLGVLELSNNALFPLNAPTYEGQAFAPLLTALAAEDAWDGGAVGFSSGISGGLAQLLVREYGNNPPVDLAERRLGPILAFYSALAGQPGDLSLMLPPTLRDAPRRQAVQPYDFEVLSLSLDLDAIQPPDTQVLADHLAANPDRFERPATWDVEAVIITLGGLAQTLEVSEDQLRLFYQNNGDDFDITEAFEVQKLTFATALEHTLFTAQRAQGISLQDALVNSTAFQINQGLRGRDQLDAGELALISGNPVGTLSQPIRNDDGTIAYLYYTNQRPARELSFEEARGQIETRVRQDMARTLFTDTVDDLQTAYGDGTLDLAALAQAAGSSVQTFAGLQTLQSAPAALQSETLFANLNFQRTPSPDISRAVLAAGEREVLVRVTAYEGPRPFTLAEAEDEVLADWRRGQARERNQAAAAEARLLLESGANLDEVAADLGGDARTLENVSRLRIAEESETLGSDLIAQIDAAAAARFTGNITTFSQQTILALNAEVVSPFAMADGQVMIVDLGGNQQIIRALRLDAPDDIQGDLDAGLVRYDLAQLDQLVRSTLTLADVADGRAYTVNQDEISSQLTAQQQQRAAQQANAAVHSGM